MILETEIPSATVGVDPVRLEFAGSAMLLVKITVVPLVALETIGVAMARVFASDTVEANVPQATPAPFVIQLLAFVKLPAALLVQ